MRSPSPPTRADPTGHGSQDSERHTRKRARSRTPASRSRSPRRRRQSYSRSRSASPPVPRSKAASTNRRLHSRSRSPPPRHRRRSNSQDDNPREGQHGRHARSRSPESREHHTRREGRVSHRDVDRESKGRESRDTKDSYRDTRRRSIDESRDVHRERDRESRETRRERGRESHRDRERNSSRDRDSHRERNSYQDRERNSRERDRDRNTPSNTQAIRSRAPLPSQESSYNSLRPSHQSHSNNDDTALATIGPDKTVEKERPNFNTTGLLASYGNTITVNSSSASNSNSASKSSYGSSSQSQAKQKQRKVVLKYHEPPESRKPSPRHLWTGYTYLSPNAKEPDSTFALAGRSCWLIGSDAGVADIHIASQRVDGQHAVLQFRYTEDKFSRKDATGKNNDGNDDLMDLDIPETQKKGKVKLYVLDVESKDGTKLNGSKIPPARYVEVGGGDVLRFGRWEGEFVVVLP